MPRKYNHTIEYDEGYDYYEDFDDEYNIEEKGEKSLGRKQKCIKKGTWRCSICTYDNLDGLIVCDICGVLRNPLPTTNYREEENTDAGDPCKDGGVSVLAKSLFTSWPNHTCHPDAPSKKSNALMGKEASFKFDVPSPDDLVICGIRSSPTVSKASFKFDVPSPDDLVTCGIRSSHTVSKGSSASVNPSLPVKTVEKVPPASANGTVSPVPEPKNSRTKNDLRKHKGSIAVSDGPAQLNLAMVGHVDSGKSTLSGRLLHLLGGISNGDMHRCEREARIHGKLSSRYAWALDGSSEERARGITMSTALAHFETGNYRVALLDSPGHRDYVPEMLCGAAQADAAVLVVDASLGSFESGMDPISGQTREHARLVRSSGVDQLIIAVNKMDVAGYSRDRFVFIQGRLRSFLRSCGFKDSSLSWVPVSAMENQNLICPSHLHALAWYNGPYLLDAVDSLRSPARDFSEPAMLPVAGVMKLHPNGAVHACGKLESGALWLGSRVLLMPCGAAGTVHSLERDGNPCAAVGAGDNVAVAFEGLDANCIRAGDVLCHPDFPVRTGRRLELKLLVLEIDTPILIGLDVTFHTHHASVPATVGRIVSVLDPKTGAVAKRSPRCLFSNKMSVVEVVLENPVCLEEFSVSRVLGRAYLRVSGRTAAVGVITHIIE